MTGWGAAGGGLRERKKRATRAALAEAAVRLAAEHGVDKVTVEAITAAAGVSVRTFFNYFDTREDAFVLIEADAGARMRQAVLDASAALSPLEALREAMVSELAEVEQRHELWRLHAEVLRASPHLLVRSLGAHMADETGLAEAVAARVRSAGPSASAPPRAPAGPGPGSGHRSGARSDSGSDEERRQALDLYPRLLAAVAGTAVRISVEHWCARQEEVAFLDVFREAFDLLAAGLPAPAA